MPAQKPAPPAAPVPAPASPAADEFERRADAYYNFSLGKLYEEMYEGTGRSEHANLSIDHYKKAYALAPEASVIGEHLAEMYFKAQRIRDAVLELQEIIAREPENLSARRLLARIYRRTIGNRTRQTGSSEIVDRAIEQYEEIFRRDPNDMEAASSLARLYRLKQDTARAEATLRRALERSPANEGLLQQLAQLLMEENRAADAIALLESPTRNTSSPELLALLGNVYLESGDAAKAEPLLRRAAELEPSEPDYHARLAQALYAQEKWNEARAEYEKLIQLDPADYQNYLRIAQVLRRLRQYDQAAEQIARARRLSPGNVEVMYSEAMLFEEQGRFDDAIQSLSNAISALRGGPSRQANRRGLVLLHEQLGRLYRETRNFAAAISTYEELLKLDPETEKRARAMMADTYRESRDIDKALEESGRTLALFPDDRGTRISHALLLADSGKSEEAAALLRAMLRGDATDREVYITLTQVFERGRRFLEAEVAIRKAELLGRGRGENEVVWFLLAAVFERQKKFDLAEEQFRKVLEVNPRNSQALNYYGYMLADRGVRLEEAAELIQRALNEEPNNGSYLDSLGWAYFKMNRLDDAEEMLLRAVQRSGQQPVIRDHLGDLYYKTGRAEKAAVEWERALQEWQRALPADRDAEQMAAVEKKLTDVKQRLARKSLPEAKPQ